MNQAKLYYSTLVVLFCSQISLGQLSEDEQRTVDSLKSVAQGNGPDTSRVSAYLEWDNLIYFYDTDLDQELNERIIEISSQNLERANLSAREMDVFYRSKGMAQNNLALLQIDFGNFYDALHNLQQSLQIAEYFKDSAKIANCYNNIGMIYKHMGMPEKALEFYDKSKDYFFEDPYSLATYYNNSGICYFDLGDPERALESYALGIAYADSCGDMVGKGNTLSNVALIKISQKKYEEARQYLEMAVPIYIEANESIGLSFAYKNLGVTSLDLGNDNMAIELCHKALQLAIESRSPAARKESCECLYIGYKSKGNIPQALHYLESFRDIKDSLQNSEKSQELIRLDFQFNSERRHLADSLEFANQNQLQKIQYETSIERKQKTQYALFAGIAVLLIIGIILLLGYQRKKKDNRIIAQQKEEVEHQKQLVEEKNKEITDSINYARRIQEAILPATDYFKSHFSESFILYRPKDIVAGDFYWLEEVGDKLIFAVADCTGHGVPGAMVSVVCHNALNRSVNEFGLIDPGKILDKTRDLVVATFERESALRKMGTPAIRDGMDISLCVYDKKQVTLQFAGANNGLYLIRDKQLIEVTPDKQPIGKYAEEVPFRTQQIEILHGDTIYLFTDGYADQFGGPEGKKYKYKQLKNLLLSVSHHPTETQITFLNQSFEGWKGNLEQVDDVCIMGIKI